MPDVEAFPGREWSPSIWQFSTIQISGFRGRDTMYSWKRWNTETKDANDGGECGRHADMV